MLGCSGEGGCGSRRAAGRGGEHHTRVVAVDHIVSVRKTRRRVVSGGGDRKAGGGAPSVVERKDGTRQVADRTTAVAVDQARFRGCPGLMASRCRVSGVE
jgi:hypothetical protein